MQPEQRQKDQHNSDSDDRVKQEQEEESQGRDYYIVNQKSSSQSQSQRERDGQKTTKKKGNNQEKKRKKKKKGKQTPFWGFSQYKRYTVKPVDPSVPKRKIIRKPIIKGQRVGGLHISDIKRVIEENKQCSGYEVGRYKLREQKKKIIQDISEKQQQEESSEQHLNGYQQQYGEQKKVQREQRSKRSQNERNSQKLRPSKEQEQNSSQLRKAKEEIRKLTKSNNNLQDKLFKNREHSKKLEQNVARLEQISFDKSQIIQHQQKEIQKLRMQVALHEKDKIISSLLEKINKKQVIQKENENSNRIYDKKETNYQQNMEQTEMKNKQPNITSVSSTQKKPLYPIFGSVDSFMRKSPNSSLEKINGSVIPNSSKLNGQVTKQKYNSAKKDDKLLVKKQQIKNAQNNKKKEQSNKNMTNLSKIHFKQPNP